MVHSVYGKVFDSIYDGTLAGHWEAIVTMQQFIVLATPDGIVDMTPEAIAGRTTIPLDIIRKGIGFLEKPDPFTRTPGEDGKRIVLLDDHRPWGWRLVNHWKYMALRNMEQKREADRVRISEKRKQNKDVAIGSQSVANVAHLDSDSDKRKEGEKTLPPGITKEDWKSFFDHRVALKKRLTPRAEELALAKLHDLAQRGYDPKKVLDLAIESGWATFYPRDEFLSVQIKVDL